jgi:hypothetical protein
MNNQIIQDINAIKREISENSRTFIQNLIRSLELKTHQSFSAYKVDLSLYYLKHLYEKVFPQKRHGGNLTTDLNQKHSKKIRIEIVRVTESVTLRKSVPLLERTIIINLFEGVKFRNSIPSFIKLFSERSSLSRSTIQNRIRVGKYLIEGKMFSEIASKYRIGLVNHSYILRKINC